MNLSLFHSIFQILYYNIHRGKNNMPLHIMNAAEIYDKYKSRELIPPFSWREVGVSYNSINGTEKDYQRQRMRLQKRNFWHSSTQLFQPESV